MHTYINIPPWFSKQNSPSRRAAAGSTWLPTKCYATFSRCPTPGWYTSPGLSINDNADPDGRNDLGAIFDRLVGEREAYYTHTLEGDDDMPAHAKSTLTGVELTIPVTRGRLNLGTWQGIYLCEFRNRAPGRRIVATIIA